MNHRFALLVLISLCPTVLRAEDDRSTDGLKVLLIAGGCCHDYATQTRLLKEGIEKRIDADVTVVFNPSKSTDTRFEIYESEDWADAYDVVLHDECSASVTERPYIDRILKAHRGGVPAVNLHCAMHSYRWGDFRSPVEPGADNAAWYEMLGVQSTSHGPQSPIEVTYDDHDHPVTRGLEDWKTTNEELYNNIRVYTGTTVLARGTQWQQPRKRERKTDSDGRSRRAEAAVVWTNEYGPKKTRIFSTTLGHNNQTVGDARYLDLVSRAVLWVTGNLQEEDAAAVGSVSLFSGKDLAGWHVDVPEADDNPDIQPTFIIRDGKLVSLGQPRGHLITDADYQDYRLDVEYRFAGEPGNCGVLVHASTPRALYDMFPKSIEVQMNHQHAGDFWCIVEDITVPNMVERRGPKENWGITEGKGRRILNLTDGSERPLGQWNQMTIECVDDEIKVWVNGDLVNHGSDCTATKGQIAIQAEGAEVEFRKLRLTPIQELSAGAGSKSAN